MNGESWLVLLLSIPISLGTGLLIGPLQALIERSKKGWELRQRQRRKDQYASILNYMLHPERLTHDLSFAILQALKAVGLLISGFGITTLILVAVIPESIGTPNHNPTGETRFILWAMGLAGAILNSLGSYQMNRVFFGMYLIRMRLANFGSYVKTLPADIREIELEELALATHKHSHPMWPTPTKE